MNEHHAPATDDGFDPKNNIVIAVVGAVGMILVIITFVIGNSMFNQIKHDKIQERVLSARNPELIDLRTRESIALGSYDWVDKEKGTVRIPIERAMELTAGEQR